METHTKPRYSLKEASALLGISENTLRRRILDGEIESHLDGDRRFITAKSIAKYVEDAAAKAVKAA